MFVTELDSFLHKFYQLKNAGYNAHLDLDTHAGHAWVGLRVQLGHEPGPLHYQVHPPFSNIQKKAEGSSRQRRRARRAAQREAAAVDPSEAAKAFNTKDNTDEARTENRDDIKTIDKTAKENESEGNFNSIIDNDNITEEVGMKIDIDTQTDNESSENVQFIMNLRTKPQVCHCGKNSIQIFECKACMGNFCDQCPNAPLVFEDKIVCLECLIRENEIYTSTPKKIKTKWK